MKYYDFKNLDDEQQIRFFNGIDSSTPEGRKIIEEIIEKWEIYDIIKLVRSHPLSEDELVKVVERLGKRKADNMRLLKK